MYAVAHREVQGETLGRRSDAGTLLVDVIPDIQPLDATAMHDAAQALVGEHDFSAFRTVACQARSPRRNVERVSVVREGEHVVLEIQANAFLHHMVRNIVGSLLVVGRGEQPREWIAELLEKRDRTIAGPTAPAAGLLFIGPRYPRQWGLPQEVCGDETTS